ncbi:MAG: Gfo/Idh/MocA family oxidoreductase [Lentisphaeria bacterium]|jgi:predicted dehydrogenase
MSSEPKMKVALIGCGRVAENHLRALTAAAVPATLAAVCDLDGAKAKAKGEKYQIPFYTDYHEMMRRHPEVEMVNVATPSGFHARHVLDLVQYKRHILVEKPMALRVEDCTRMIAAAEQAGVRLFVVKQNRFNPAVQAARQALEAGRFGKLVLVTTRVRWHRDPEYYATDNWHGTWALDGGVMSQQASHHLDLLQWFGGPIAAVHCRQATRLMPIEVEDTAVATFQFQSGALGAYEATVCANPDNLEGSLSILGEKGSVVIGGHAVNFIQTWKFSEPLPEDAEIQEKYSQNVPNVYGHGHNPYIAHVVECIRGNRPAMVDGAEGRKNIEIMTAMYESAALAGAPTVPGQPTPHCRLGSGVARKPGFPEIA